MITDETRRKINAVPTAALRDAKKRGLSEDQATEAVAHALLTYPDPDIVAALPELKKLAFRRWVIRVIEEEIGRWL